MRTLLSLLPALLAALIATSADAQSLTLSPAVVPLKGAYGQSATQTLTLRNDSDIPMDFVLEARDVVVRNGERTFVAAGELGDGIAATAVFDPATITILPRSSGSVQATVTLPRETRQRAMAAYFRGTNRVQAGQRLATMSLGALLTFTVSDRVSLSATNLSATAPTVAANAQLSVVLTNNGDEPIVPAGTAAILDAMGRFVGKAAFPQRRLLPGERATLSVEYQGELAPGAYRVISTFDAGGKPVTTTTSLAVQ